MRLTYEDLETGWQMVREGEQLTEIRDGEVANVSTASPLKSIEFHGTEFQKPPGPTYYVLTINDNYPWDVVECTAFRIDS